MLIVADSSALIALATCDGLDVLLELYEEVKVPQAVYMEVTESDKPQATALEVFLSGRVVEVDYSHWVLAADRLGQGEIEAMALYKQLSADALLIDDHRARVIAEHNKINCIGALGVLLFAKQEGKIEKVMPYVQKPRHSSIYYGETLLDKVLSLAGES
jgi:predicted nucleic acid-binding protein